MVRAQSISPRPQMNNFSRDTVPLSIKLFFLPHSVFKGFAFNFYLLFRSTTRRISFCTLPTRTRAFTETESIFHCVLLTSRSSYWPLSQPISVYNNVQHCRRVAEATFCILIYVGEKSRKYGAKNNKNYSKQIFPCHVFNTSAPSTAHSRVFCLVNE